MGYLIRAPSTHLTGAVSFRLPRAKTLLQSRVLTTPLLLILTNNGDLSTLVVTLLTLPTIGLATLVLKKTNVLLGFRLLVIVPIATPIRIGLRRFRSGFLGMARKQFLTLLGSDVRIECSRLSFTHRGGVVVVGEISALIVSVSMVMT